MQVSVCGFITSKGCLNLFVVVNCELGLHLGCPGLIFSSYHLSSRDSRCVATHLTVTLAAFRVLK